MQASHVVKFQEFQTDWECTMGSEDRWVICYKKTDQGLGYLNFEVSSFSIYGKALDG